MLGQFKDMKSRIKGFTLIELSIAITIISFLVVNAIVMTESNEAVAEQGDVIENLGDVKRLLNEFAIYNGYLPCPADPYAQAGTATYGLEAREESCGGAELCPCDQDKLFGEMEVSRKPNESPMVVGTLPQKFLIGREGDAWGKNITYAVTIDNTTPEGFLKYRTGQIKVYKNDSVNTNPAFLPTSGATLITDKAAYVLLSHGPNGVGAFDPLANNPSEPENLSGILRILPRVILNQASQPVVIDNKYDWHNHHLYDRHAHPADDTPTGKFHQHKHGFDRIFVQSLIPSRAQEGEGNSVFDDILIYGKKTDIIWGRDQNNTISDNIPDMIPGLVQWLEPDPDNIVLFNAKADQWNEKGSLITLNNIDLGLMQAISAVPLDTEFTPSLLEFGISGLETTVMTGTEMEFDTGFTLYMVVKTDDIGSTGGDKTILHMANSDTVVFEDFLKVKSVAGDGSLMEFTINGTTSQFPNTNTTSEFAVLGVKFNKDDTNVTYFRNTSKNLAAATPLDSFDLYCIGGEYDIPAVPVCKEEWDGNFAEMIIYDNNLSNGQHNMILGYLANKYNIEMANWNGNIDWCDMDGGLRVQQSCSSDSSCCSGKCKSVTGGGKKCCMPTIKNDGAWEYNNTADRCGSNKDCCDSGAICNMYGWCWKEDSPS